MPLIAYLIILLLAEAMTHRKPNFFSNLKTIAYKIGDFMMPLKAVIRYD